MGNSYSQGHIDLSALTSARLSQLERPVLRAVVAEMIDPAGPTDHRPAGFNQLYPQPPISEPENL